MKLKYKQAYMDMAARFALTSSATKLQVAALLIKDESILSIGINGTPKGYWTNHCEDAEGRTEWYVRHAEAACLEKMLHSTETTDNCCMFITVAPCRMCALRIKEANIKSIFYRCEYKNTEGLEYLEENGVKIEQVK